MARTRWMTAVALLLGTSARAAMILTPASTDNGGNPFPDQGPLSASTDGSFNSNGPAPTLTVGPTTYTGTVYTYSNGNQAAVFEFDSINVASGAMLTGTGALPVVLLSKGDVTISGDINFSGVFGGNNTIGGPGGPGGGGGSNDDSSGAAGGGSGGGTSSNHGYGAGGGGYGGAGGTGGGPFTSAGGLPYGDLTQSLQGGSGGGEGGGNDGGAGGGGGLEIASGTAINVFGSVLADGGESTNGGGGSGGGLLLYAPAVTLFLFSGLHADGGPGGELDDYGGAGGGGRILIDTSPLGFTNIHLLGPSKVTAAGGTVGSGGGLVGADGTVTYLTDVPPAPAAVVPEPSTLGAALTGLFCLAAAHLARRRARR